MTQQASTQFDFNTTFYEDAIFCDLDLASTKLSGIEFTNCQFNRCILKESKWDSCILENCEFDDCDASLADFSFSKLVDLHFVDCKLLGIDWTKVSWRAFVTSPGISFERCRLDNCSFYGLTFTDTTMTQCRAHDVDFREADLSSSDFQSTDLTNAAFNSTDLRQANFTDASYYDIDIRINNVKGAVFSRLEATNLLRGFGIRIVD